MFRKELKKTVTSITYILFVALLLFFVYTQIGTSFEKVEPPKPDDKSFGVKYEENPEIIMPSAVASLSDEFTDNSYIAYPIGFYKNVKLNEKKQKKMAAILSELKGQLSSENRLSYSRFQELMKEADKLIGGGSKYSTTYLKDFGTVPATYEDAIREYNSIVEKDRMTGALARLFSDYIGIVLSIFPVFVAVAIGLRDRRANMQGLIFTRRVSSIRFIFCRYIAMVAAMFLPVLALALYATIQTASEYASFDINLLAFFTYSIGWLLPTLMVSTAVGVFLTELTDSPIAIVVQGLWWLIGINIGIKHIKGGYGADLAIRHNTVGNTDLYLEHFNILLMNRFGYTLFALTLVMATIWIYEQKRRGKLDVRSSFEKIFNHRKVKFKA